jgi:hypothetical protein
MLDRFAARAHRVGVFVESFLRGLGNGFMFPAVNAPLFSRRAFRLQRASPAGIRPIAPKFLPFLLLRVIELQSFSSRAAISILLRLVDEILLAETPLGFRARCHRLRQSYGDAGVVADLDLFAVLVAATC